MRFLAKRKVVLDVFRVLPLHHTSIVLQLQKHLVAGTGFEPVMTKAYETPLVTRPYPQLKTLKLGGNTRTRTETTLRPQGPKPCASTNFAILPNSEDLI